MANQVANGQDKRILGEQIQLLYKQTWAMLGINLSVGAAFVYGMASIFPLKDLLQWYGFLVLVFTTRIGIYFAYNRDPHKTKLRFYAWLFVLGAFANALVWAAASLIFFDPHEFKHQLLIIFVLTGMGAGSVASMYTYRPAFLAYFLTSNVPIALRLLYEQDQAYTATSLLFIIYILGLCFFAARINKTYIEALLIRNENRELVNELREQKEEAEKANQAKSKFLAAASHDLRQPLHALNLYASILASNIAKPKNKKLVDQITHSLEALESLFNALLDISRLEAGTLVPERRNFRIEPLINRVLSDFEGDARQKSIQLRAQANEIICYSDASLLEQIIRNYVSNAIRYTNSGEISITCEVIDGQVEIKVKDTGIGIPADQLDAIYGEFYQLSNPERDRSKGLGLGLAIVHRISNLLEHKIGVQSQSGKGSTFSVTVPLGSSATYIDLPRSSIEWMQNTSLERINIAVIDDDVDVRESTEALFVSWGCSVYAGASPQDVIEKLRKQNVTPHAIIADYRLRGGRTGIGAIDLVKAQYAEDIPSLIITGETGSEPLQAIQNSGIPVLNKPVSPVKFRAFLQSLQADKEVNEE